MVADDLVRRGDVQAVGEALVEVGAVGLRRAVVGDLADERVVEAEGVRARGVDQAPADEAAERALVRRRRVEQLAPGELPTDDGRAPEHAHLARAEPVDAAREQRLERRGRALVRRLLAQGDELLGEERVAPRAVDERGHEPHERTLKQRDAPLQIQPQIDGDLFVPRAARVQPSSGLADAGDQLTLDERVDVLVGGCRLGGEERGIVRTAENLAERSGNGVCVAFRQHAGAPERLGPRNTSGDVVGKEAPIKTEGRAEIEEAFVGIAVETA